MQDETGWKKGWRCKKNLVGGDRVGSAVEGLWLKLMCCTAQRDAAMVIGEGIPQRK
jgi:hypothetical protein